MATTSEPCSRPSGAAFLLDKPRGSTSRKAGGEVARCWGFARFGHAGTLDPDATGLLIVLLGKATRLARFVVADRKSYSFGVRLGIVTDTDDLTGRVLERHDADGVSLDAVREALARLTGEIRQKVPVFSAVRVGGVRSFRTARRGLVPDTPVRPAETSEWRLERMEGNDLRLAVTVSAGTYVRALARDLGALLGTGGAAFDIRRTSIGPFSVEEASASPDAPHALVAMADLLRGMPALRLDPPEAAAIRLGRPLGRSESGTLALLDGDGCLIGVGEGDGASVRSLCVLGGD